jgi:hypothetical protein
MPVGSPCVAVSIPSCGRLGRVPWRCWEGIGRVWRWTRRGSEWSRTTRCDCRVPGAARCRFRRPSPHTGSAAFAASSRNRSSSSQRTRSAICLRRSSWETMRTLRLSSTAGWRSRRANVDAPNQRRGAGRAARAPLATGRPELANCGNSRWWKAPRWAAPSPASGFSRAASRSSRVCGLPRPRALHRRPL